MIQPDLVQKALTTIRKRQADYEYFFSQLKTPVWIKPLKEAGMFGAPPTPRPEGEYISFPRWPESEYLARMAAQAPDVVLEVILEMPITENVRVNEDLIDAALSMPPQLATKLNGRAKQWAESNYSPLFPEKLGTFVAYLADGGEKDGALSLARTVLAVLPDPNSDRYVDDNPYHLSPQPRARFGIWEYKIILQAVIPSLIRVGREEAFSLFCDLLTDAIRLSRNRSDDPGPEDYSYIWRANIDSSSGHDDVKEVLVSAVRRAAEELLKTLPDLLINVVRQLEARPWVIFHRIALYLLHLLPEVGKDLITERLTNVSIFGVLGLWHEFFILARENFSQLNKEQQSIFLNWVSAGPPSGMFDTEKEERYWKLRRLAPIRDVLSAEARVLYDQLVAEFGEIQWPEYASPPISVHVGYESPKSVEELSQMSFEEIISFLKEWQPSDPLMRETPEGLGQQLTAMVASDPERFAQEIEQIKQLDPTYVRAVLSGLHEALRQKGAVAWPTVLRLCKWVVEQPSELTGTRGRITERDPDWTWTKGSIESLIEEGLKSETASIPFEFRRAVWDLLLPLTEDPHPTASNEAASNMDPLTLSLNTLRGQAMHCVFRYALWCKRHLESEDSGNAEFRGFDSMPEVREALDRHLDPAYEPSLAIRAVYGQWLPWLTQIDSQWTKANLQKIFPKEDRFRSMLNATWDTYVVFNQPYNDVFNILRQEYRTAVDRIGTTESKKTYGRDPDDRLAEHLMILYARGKIRFEEEDGLLESFYEVAPGDVRGHAIWFFGRDLIEMKEAIPNEVLQRLKALWSRRIEEAHAADSKGSYTSELSAFGGWFASGKFDDLWSITQLRDVLQVTGLAQPYHTVLERLAKIAPLLPDIAVESLSLLIEGDKKRQYTYVWHEHLRTILIAAITSADKMAQQSAKSLINKLLARDRAYGGFRELLQIANQETARNA
ncbi:MAG TPA: hypothetical protein VI306_21370 [Pyrinomonadaceae bacterium]